ncbi:MAG: recombinase family protein [Deltaproteobacteria bacterium]|nr:recombinase family protein [Deltaproteobacteria bacterium]
MGSQSGDQTNWGKNGRKSHLFLIDTFEHDLLKHLAVEDQVHDLYAEDQFSLKQIALRMDVSRDYVRKALFRKGIPVIRGRRETDLTGQIPYGWKRREGKLVPYRIEQLVIERMKRARVQGMSLHEIARRLNSSGTPTKAGGRWHAKSISQILSRNSDL